MAHDMREFQDEVLAAAEQVSSTDTGTGIDISKYIGSLKVSATVAKVSGTTPTYAGKLQESDTLGGTYTDVTGGAFTALSDESGDETIHVETRALKSFIRYVATLGGTNPVFNQAVIVVGRKQTGGQ